MGGRQMKEPLDRRRFLCRASNVALASVFARLVHAKDGSDPDRRATSGDAVEPDWSERLTVTVGPDRADLVGANEKVLQAAVDYVARLGGGTVRVLPGTFHLRNAVY